MTLVGCCSELVYFALADSPTLRASNCLVQVGKGYAGRANKATTKAEAAAICEEGFASVEKLYL